METGKKLTNKLNQLLVNKGGYIRLDKVIKFLNWKMTGNEITFVYEDVATGVKITNPVTFDILDGFLASLTPIEESHETPSTLTDLKKILLINIAKLQNGLIEREEAREIASQVQTVVNITKLELQYYREFKEKKMKRYAFIENGQIISEQNQTNDDKG